MREHRTFPEEMLPTFSGDGLRARTPTLRDDTRFANHLEPRTGSTLPAGGLRRATITGALEAGLFPGVLQILAEKRSSGLIWVHGPGVTAAIRFLDGLVVDAQCGHLHGDEAFNRVMTTPRGTYVFEPARIPSPGLMCRTVYQLLVNLACATAAQPVARAV